MYNRLGAAIIESLQEEIGNGIKLMEGTFWSGISTIPDHVLLRIIETSAKSTFNGFPKVSAGFTARITLSTCAITIK